MSDGPNLLRRGSVGVNRGDGSWYRDTDLTEVTVDFLPDGSVRWVRGTLNDGTDVRPLATSRIRGDGRLGTWTPREDNRPTEEPA